MPREEVSFARGTKATMPQDKVPGRLLIATDTGEAYVDDTATSRVQLKDTTKVSKSGDTMSGPLNMGSNKITNVATPTADTDAANLGSVKSETAKVKYTGGTAITVDDSDKTISHNNIGTAGSVGPSANATPAPGGTFNVPQITTDAQGHVSSKTNRTVTIPQYSAGTGLSISGTAISHANNGTAGSYGPTGNVTPGYGGNFQIPQITTNAQGHVTAITMRTVTLPSAQDIPEVETYTGVPPITVSGTQISHETSVTAGNRGPTRNSTVSPGNTFTVPQIYYDAYGHVTSATNRTMTLSSSILDTSDILTSLSGVSSNKKVLGAKLVADAINNLNNQVSTLNTNFRNYYSGTNRYIDDIYVHDGDRYFCVMSNQGTDGISNLYTVGILEINNTATSCTYRSLHNTLSNSMTWTISNNLVKVNVSDRQYLSLLLLKINAEYAS